MLYLLLASTSLLLSPVARMAAPVMQLTSDPIAPVGAVSGGVVPTRKAPVSADSSILVQGGSLRTWSYRSPAVEQVQVVLSTEGRPLDADIELSSTRRLMQKRASICPPSESSRSGAFI